MYQTGSKGEQKIEKILKSNGVNYKREYIFSDLKKSKRVRLRFDFAIFDDDGDIIFVIEYQGSQHYAPCEFFGGERQFKRQVYNDDIKRQYCRAKNIQLLEIPFVDYDKLNFDYIMSRVDFI